jgi:hypothetical protein
MRPAAAAAVTLLFIASPIAGARAADDECPAEGAASDRTRADPDLNRLKNREDVPAKFEPVTFEEILQLPAPPRRSQKEHRRRWPRETLQEIQKSEQRAVSLEGFLRDARVEGKESTNCYEETDRDFHLWLAPKADDRKASAIVVEVTPRVRAKHAAWSIKNLKRFVKDHAKVRVSGMAMLDPEHPEQLGRTRATLWELHPVLQIDVWSNGTWRTL